MFTHFFSLKKECLDFLGTLRRIFVAQLEDAAAAAAERRRLHYTKNDVQIRLGIGGRSRR